MDFSPYILAASGDGGGLEFWFWLIVGGVYVIKKIIDFLKGKTEEETPEVMNEEPEHERRIKDVIQEMRRQQGTTPLPSHIPPARPNPADAPARRQQGTTISPVKLPTPAVTRNKPIPAAEPLPSWASATPNAQDNARHSMESYAKETEAARHSIQSLSDAERDALQRLQRQKPETVTTATATAPAVSGNLSLQESLKKAQSLRTAILYQEILGKPKALQLSPPGTSFGGN